MKFSDFINTDEDRPKIKAVKIKTVLNAHKLVSDVKNTALIVEIEASNRMDLLNITQFLSGVCCAIDGNLIKLDDNILLCISNKFQFENDLEQKETTQSTKAEALREIPIDLDKENKEDQE